VNHGLENASTRSILTRIAGLPDEVVKLGENEQPCVFRSRVFPPVEWNEQEICEQLNIVLPVELKQFWMYASEVRIETLEEGNCMRSGIYISSPLDVLEFHHRKISEEFPERYTDGDLIIGERVGDLMLFVVRCKQNLKDFGTVLLSNPIDQRKDWQVVGKTVTEFLANCLSGKV